MWSIRVNIFIKLAEENRDKINLSEAIKDNLFKIRLFLGKKNIILIFLENIIKVIMLKFC